MRLKDLQGPKVLHRGKPLKTVMGSVLIINSQIVPQTLVEGGKFTYSSIEAIKLLLNRAINALNGAVYLR